MVHKCFWFMVSFGFGGAAGRVGPKWSESEKDSHECEKISLSNFFQTESFLNSGCVEIRERSKIAIQK